MSGNDKTVWDDKTVLEDRTVLDDRTVMDNGIAADEDRTVYDRSGSRSVQRAAQASSDEDHRFMPGATLMDTYQIEGDAIHGGMGSVWRVHHTGWNIDLAMKRPLPQMFVSETAKENFIAECQSWINLGLHPNIVSCYYVREIDGVPTIFSEWMDNGSLESHIKKGTLYEGDERTLQARLLDIAIQYARGLHYAHENGLIHQDVKPDNLLLTKDWQAKAADFGLARARRIIAASDSLPGADETHVAAFLGTLGYCSAEQMDGKPLTRRTDIYSWAVSVLEMYLGSRPWQNGVVAGMSCRGYFDSCRVPMPQALQELLTKCMEQDPKDRPHDFAVVETELERIYADTMGTAYPRKTTKAAADTADSLNNRALSYLDMGMEEQAEALWKQALEKEPENLPAMYNQSLYLWRKGFISFAELLRRCEPLFERNDEAKARLFPLLKTEEADRSPMVLRKVEEEDHMPGRTSVDFTFYSNGAAYTAVSPDGKWVYSLLKRLQCHDARTGKLRYSNNTVWPENEKSCSFLLISPDGRFLVYCFHHEDCIRVADAETGQLLRTLHYQHIGRIDPLWGVQRRNTQRACMHPTLNLLYTTDETRIFKWNLETGELLREYMVPPEINAKNEDHSIMTLCVSPETHRLYAGLMLHDIAEWDEETGKWQQTLSMQYPRTLAASPDGTALYSSHNGETCMTVYTQKQVMEPFCQHQAEIGYMQLSRDGNTLLLTDDKHLITLWERNEHRQTRAFREDQIGIEGISASADLSVIAAGSKEKTILVWDTRKPIRLAPWELSRIKNFVEQMQAQQMQQQLYNDIEKRIADGKLMEAVSLLEQAEESFASYQFLHLRKKLNSLLQAGKLKRVYEVNRFACHPGNASQYEQMIPATTADIDGFAVLNTGFFDSRVLFYSADGKLIREVEIPGICDANHDLPHAPGQRCRFRSAASGHRLVAASGREVTLIDTQRMEVLPKLKGLPDEVIQSIGITPDGSRVMICTVGYLGIWDTESGQKIAGLNLEHGKLYNERSAVLMNDGRRALLIRKTMRNPGMLETILEQYDIIDRWRFGTQKIYRNASMCLSPTEDALYLDSGWVYDPRTLKHISSFSLSADNISDAAISPDGKLMFLGSKKGIRLIDLLDGSCIWQGPELETSARGAFSSDGCTLYVGHGKDLRIYALCRELLPKDQKMISKHRVEAAIDAILKETERAARGRMMLWKYDLETTHESNK